MSAEAEPAGIARPHDAGIDEARVAIHQRRKKRHIFA